MPALGSLVTALLLVFPIFGPKPAPSPQIITPLAHGEVLGAHTPPSQNDQPSAEFKSLIGQILKNPPAPTPVQTAESFPKTFKGQIKILVLGSTQTKTLRDGQSLITKLNSYYPNVKFEFVNYSSDQSGIDYALAKTSDTFLENSQIQSSVIFQEPDILIIDTFGYDPNLQNNLNLETHTQKLINLANLVFSYNKSQNIFISSLAPVPDNFSETYSDINQRYGAATLTLNNITQINQLLAQNSMPVIDITTASVPEPENTQSQYITGKFTPTSEGLEIIENKIIEYLINNQNVDKGLENQKIF